MTAYHATFHDRGHTVESRIVARNTHVATQPARQHERAWRMAVDRRLKEQ